MRSLLFFLTFILLTINRAGTVYGAQKTVLIVNQVRGNECCDDGNMEHVKQQIASLAAHGFPAAFALRYDVLTDAQYVSIFMGKPHIELGLFLEITPVLARDAGVPYAGPVDKWYKAKNAYLLGYTPTERKKIIDTAMKAFKKVVGVYPTTTVAWMIDAGSLQYVTDTYGVTLHQITRDQWGTDSYTLYGGPIGAPYVPSKNWALIPASSTSAALPLTIIRQTIVDPVENYGDTYSVTTSQPNDYMNAGRSETYFEKLMLQALSQQPAGFAVIGLESSMGPQYQKAFFKQLEVLTKLKSKDETIHITTPREYAAIRKNQEVLNPVSLYHGQSGAIAAAWITTPSYRVRLLFNEHTHKVVVDDLRIYSDQLIDPYAHVVPETPNAYWIVPFTIDGSRYYQSKKEGRFTPLLQSLKKRLGIFDPCMPQGSVRSDVCTEPDALTLPTIDSLNSLVFANNTVTYATTNGDLVSLRFTPSSFSFDVPSQNSVSFAPSSAAVRSLHASTLFGFDYAWKGNSVTFTPRVSPSLSMDEISKNFPEAFVPEIAGGTASLSSSLLIPSRSIIELGRNPIRIVMYMRDQQNRIATSSMTPTLSLKEDEHAKITVAHPETSLGEYYLDAMPTRIGAMTPTVSLGNETKTLPSLLVVPHCLKTIQCVTNPWLFVRWIEMNIRDRLH